MAIPESQSRVLEDGQDALVEGTVGEAVAGEGEEIVDLTAETAAPAAPAAPAPDEKQPAPAAKAPAAPAPAVDEDAELPNELRGKSRKDLARMLQHSQSLIGRQGSELGELRGKIDTVIKMQLENARRGQQPAAPAAPAAPEVPDESEFFAKPQDAVSKMIENHPVIRQIAQTLGASQAAIAQQRAVQATERFNASHPDAGQILRDGEFRQWVEASPIRKALLKRAHTAFDYAAGDEVFSTWKALKGVRKPAPAAPAAGTPAASDVSAAAATLAKARTAKQAAAAQAAAVPSGGSSAGKNTGGKKIYRRVQVLDLMENHPEKYEAIAEELALAYKEGRVR